MFTFDVKTLLMLIYMRRIITLSLSMLLVYSSLACTTAIISGKYTADGRPILWKLRDTDEFQNKLRYFTDGKYAYLGLVNTSDTQGTQVWGGFNSTGFAIMNSASYNTNLTDTSKFADQEGRIMKLALQQCATLADFEQLLASLPKPMGLNANFGVIDANGGAAYYETDNYTFVKFDANDPAVAPNGYIIRTNFSFTGKKDVGYGFIRYQSAVELFANADARGDLTLERVYSQFSRSMYHSLLGVDYASVVPQQPMGSFIAAEDLLCRYATASNIVVHGVKPGESANLTTMWAQIAFPLTTVNVPVWLTPSGDLPSVVSSKNDQHVLLADYGMALKSRIFPIERGSGSKYLDMAVYQNSTNGGVRSQIERMEAAVVSKANTELTKWRASSIDAKQVKDFYDWVDSYVQSEYKGAFGL